MDHFHSNCQGCHKELKAQGKESGPVVCGECHAVQPEYTSNRVLMPMDLSLHARHIKEMNSDCGKCHHTYDDASQGISYKKGTESNCRDCHEAGGKGQPASMKTASHWACVTCHMNRASQNLSSGPINCAGCHKAENISKIKKLARTPRLRLSGEQPDVTLVDSSPKRTKTIQECSPYLSTTRDMSFILGVAAIVTTTRCALATKCHTVKGNYKGKKANLETAFHSFSAEQSCVGCHNKYKKEQECAGCHMFMSFARLPDNTCTKCHFEPP